MVNGLGYGGDDMPKAVFPTKIGVYPDEQSMEIELEKKNKSKYLIGSQLNNVFKEDFEVKEPYRNQKCTNYFFLPYWKKIKILN